MRSAANSEAGDDVMRHSIGQHALKSTTNAIVGANIVLIDLHSSIGFKTM